MKYNLVFLSLVGVSDCQRDYSLPECVYDYDYWYRDGCPQECTSCGLCRQCYDDCIACQEGFEIDMKFSDGTGSCVPEGEASNPLN